MGTYNSVDDIYIGLLDNLIKQEEHKDPKREGVTRKGLPLVSLDINTTENVPLLTCKRVYLESAVRELNMFLGGNMNISKLNARFWDSDAYNYYKRLVKLNNIKHSILSLEEFVEASGKVCEYIPDYNYGDLGKVYGELWEKQLDNIINQLKKSKYHTDMLCLNTDHRIKNDIYSRALEPCHFAFQIVPTNDGVGIIFNMRSSDVFLGLPTNILFYYLLGNYIVNMSGTGLKLTNVYPVLANPHLYNNTFNFTEDILKSFEPNNNKYVVHSDFKYIPGKVIFNESVTHKEYLGSITKYSVRMLAQSNNLL